MAETDTTTTVRGPAEGRAVDPLLLRRAMGRFATGVTVVTTRRDDGRLEGLTANSFSTVSLDPPLVLWSVARRARSFAAFSAARHFAVNVLAVEQLSLCRHFAAPHADKFAGIAIDAGLGGCPLLPDALAHFECVRETAVEGGDHVILVGRVLAASFRDGDPLVFAGGTYHQIAPIG